MRSWAALVLVLSMCSCATTRGDQDRLAREVRDLQDQVYTLEKSRESLRRRIAILEGNPEPPRSQQQPRAEPRVRPTDNRVIEPVSAVSEPARVSSGSADQQFSAAEDAFGDRDFARAIGLFREFLRLHSTDGRVARVLYLLGESYYAEANFAQAIVELGKVTDGYPNDPNAPDAIYKIALSYYELGYERNALEHLDRLESSYPDARATAAAKPLHDRLRDRKRRR